MRPLLGLLLFLFALHASAQQSELPTNAFSPVPDSLNIVRIAAVVVKGNKKTKEYIIRREFFFKEGDSVSVADLNKQMEETRNYLMNTTLFVEVKVFIREFRGSAVSVEVAVKERWYIFPLPYFKLVDRNFNQWWVENKRSLDRVNYGIKFNYYNFTGRRDNLSMNLITGYGREVQLKYDQPFVEKTLKHGLGLAFRFSKQKEVMYDTRLNKQVFFKYTDFVRDDIHAEISYYYRPAIKSRHAIRVSFNRTNVNDSVAKLNPAYLNGLSSVTYPEFAYTYNYYNADYIPYPTKGLLMSASLVRRGINSAVDMWQLAARVQLTQPVIPKTQLQFELAGTIKLPFEQPFYNQGMFGYGEMYLRGQEYYVVDGVAGIIGKTTLQTQLLSFTLKNPYKIRSLETFPFRFVIKTFADFGYAYSKNELSNTLNNTPLRTWGVGMDIITIYDMVLKIEYSFNQLGNRGLFLHSKNEF